MVDWALTKRFQIRNAAESVMEVLSGLKDFEVLPEFALRWRNSQSVFVFRKSRLTLSAIQRLKVLPQPAALPQLLQ